MSSELEGLIAGLVTRISCAGEQGCTVPDLLEAIQKSFKSAENVDERQEGTSQSSPETLVAQRRAASTVWKWLASRRDISVGLERKYNRLSLEDVLELDSVSRQNGRNEGDDSKEPSSSTPGIRVYALEETMWESLTGHAIDYRRVPRSEWILLLGIASKTTEGILQGDLGRLVDQDKRSVPKRTDSLLRKGYIAKRTTLVRGTKTSKMWLRIFAPPLPRDGENAFDEPRPDMNITRQVLVDDLSPVPWHPRWTGESIDYIALATTIMAVAKEWGVLKMQDLKSKLGVLGMRWQMKVIAKVCRFLNARGVIQYVAAMLGDKIFKDCIKFSRDMSSEDWSIFLATGKRTKRPTRNPDLSSVEGLETSDAIFSEATNVSEVSSAPPWSIDKPLSITIVEMAQRLRDTGLTNPDVYAMTLGPSFSRYLSSTTTSISTPNLQPPHLQHLQLRSEHSRVGKVASYKYFGQNEVESYEIADIKAELAAIASEPSQGETQPRHSFGPLPSSILAPSNTNGLANLCKQSRQNQRKKRPLGRPPKAVQVDEEAGEVIPAKEDQPPKEPDQPKKRGRKRKISSAENETQDSETLVVNLKVSPVALQSVAGEEEDDELGPRRSSRPRRLTSTVQTVETEMVESLLESADEVDVPEKPASATKKRGRGRGRRGKDTGDASRPWKCEKCGRSWKNDIGLKYHLEKSRTSCNPLFDESAPIPPRKRKKRSPEPVEPTPEPSVRETTPRSDISTDAPVAESSAPRAQTQISLSPVPYKATPDKLRESMSLRPPINLAGGPLQTGLDRGSLQERRYGKATLSGSQSSVLLDPEASQPRPVLAMSGSIDTSSAFKTPSQKKTQTQQLPKIDGQASSLRQPPPATPEGMQNGSLRVQESTDNPENGSGVSYDTEIRDAAPIVTAGEQKDASLLTPLKESVDSPARSNLPRTVLSRRVSEIITDILASQKGVFPGGKALWHAISTIWEEKYADDPIPSMRTFQAGLRELVKKKAAAEHLHAFRDAKGMFTKCQIVIDSSVDPFSPEATALFDKIREAHPRLYLPSPFTAPVEVEQAVEGPRGRRKLPGEVEVLDAPLYAAQAIAKKALKNLGLGVTTPKRGKRKAKDIDDIASSPKRARVKWASQEQGDDGFQRQDAIFTSATLPQPFKTVQFLEPNTYLDEEHPENMAPIRQRSRTKSADAKLQKQRTSLPENFFHGMVVDNVITLDGSDGSWPSLAIQFFEENDASFTLNGWMPDAQWFAWSSLVGDLKRRSALRRGRTKNKRTARGYRQLFTTSVLACLELEKSYVNAFVSAPSLAAGPHNVFIRFVSGPIEAESYPTSVQWPAEEQLTAVSFKDMHPVSEDEPVLSDDNVDFSDWAEVESFRVDKSLKADNQLSYAQATKTKRVELLSRALTPLPKRHAHGNESGNQSQDQQSGSASPANPDRLLAAFVAMRVLLGGADKAVDWGLLLQIFPEMGIKALRRFWVDARKDQGTLITKLTKDFQDKFLAAYEMDDLPELDYDDPQDYDWHGLIDWTLQLQRKKEMNLPMTRQELTENFSTQELGKIEDDWREKFFHPQASVFSRFEWATAQCAAVPIDGVGDSLLSTVTELDLARSWVRSLCCSGDARYSVQQIKNKFSVLSRTSIVQEAIDQLTLQRVICKSKKHLFGGRPYRLNEYFTYMVEKLSQHSKYMEAAAFKAKLDAVFRRGEKLTVPYTLDDGSVMAITNLNAAGRIRVVPVDIPHIPFGFVPGNYESRKFPKSYYYFGMQVVPTETYQYNEDIEVLGAALREGPPLGSSRGELPQWVDFDGGRDAKRWAAILGGFCFSCATRGSLSIEGICAALKPIIEGYEARVILDWGKRTGLLEETKDGLGVSVGEWWWLVVPSQSTWTATKA